VVDLSGIEAADPFNHTKFADNPALVKLLGKRLRQDGGYPSDREVSDRIRMLGLGG
jgi:esterase/lipase superfamily enzyme